MCSDSTVIRRRFLRLSKRIRLSEPQNSHIKEHFRHGDCDRHGNDVHQSEVVAHRIADPPPEMDAGLPVVTVLLPVEGICGFYPDAWLNRTGSGRCRPRSVPMADSSARRTDMNMEVTHCYRSPFCRRRENGQKMPIVGRKELGIALK